MLRSRWQLGGRPELPAAPPPLRAPLRCGVPRSAPGIVREQQDGTRCQPQASTGAPGGENAVLDDVVLL